MAPSPPTSTESVSRAGHAAATWGILGFVLILLRGAWRITPQAMTLFDMQLDMLHWMAAGASVMAFGVGEGYVAIQRHYIPRLLDRADRLRRNPAPLFVLFAPLYCMGLIGGDVRTTLRGWGMVAAIILMIVLMRFVEQPWRAIILIGVVLALVWAAAATLGFGARFLLRGNEK